MGPVPSLFASTHTGTDRTSGPEDVVGVLWTGRHSGPDRQGLRGRRGSWVELRTEARYTVIKGERGVGGEEGSEESKYTSNLEGNTWVQTDGSGGQRKTDRR